MKTLAEMDDAEITRFIIDLRRRLAEAEQRLSRDPDEAGVIATILPTVREIIASRPQHAPKLEALIDRYQPLAARAK